jgi:hypothetical protein
MINFTFEKFVETIILFSNIKQIMLKFFWNARCTQDLVYCGSVEQIHFWMNGFVVMPTWFFLWFIVLNVHCLSYGFLKCSNLWKSLNWSSFTVVHNSARTQTLFIEIKRIFSSLKSEKFFARFPEHFSILFN